MMHLDPNRIFSKTQPGIIRLGGWLGEWLSEWLRWWAVGSFLMVGCGIDKPFIYHPEQEIKATPESVGLSYENIYFQSADGVRLNGWFVPGPDPSNVMIWFHGNGGNIGHRVKKLRLIHDDLGLSIFIFDYRQYGQSGGSVTEEGTYWDARAALEYVKSRTGLLALRIIYFGESLGSAVAVDLALKAPPRALILESPITSIHDMARAKLPYLPVGFLIDDKYDSFSKIRKIHVPLLILHGDRDEVVPFDQGRRLFEAANPPKEFYVIPGAHHNDTYIVGGQPYWEAMKKFLDRLE
ncbi:MAG: alpha/beta hydrolase [Nitrospirae bacterium]|nr:alpha/beta hydrolase [Nitrospirota bacterium]